MGLCLLRILCRGGRLDRGLDDQSRRRQQRRSLPGTRCDPGRGGWRHGADGRALPPAWIAGGGFDNPDADHDDPHARCAGPIHAGGEGPGGAGGLPVAVAVIPCAIQAQEECMRPRLSRTQIPLLATISVFVVLYAAAALRYPGFLSWAVFRNLVADNGFLGLAAIGMTFVILAGGIDLSVGAMIGFSSILIAKLTAQQVHPLLASTVAVIVGTGLGACMGGLIRF